MTTKDILEKGKELNLLHSEYKCAEKPRDKKAKWQAYYAAAEKYRQDYADYMRRNPADICKTL